MQDLKSLRLFFISEFFGSIIFFETIWILFYQAKGLSITNIGLIVSAVYLASFIFEYPSGIFADKYGRKASIILSYFCWIFALLIEIFTSGVFTFFIAGLFIGTSHAFSSGATEAFIYDTLKEKKLEKLNTKALGYKDAIQSSALLLSTITAGYLFLINQTIPHWFTAIATFIGLGVLIFVKEPKRKEKISNVSKEFKEGFKLVFSNPTILTILIIFIPLFLYDDAWYNLYQIILTDLGLSIGLLGLFAGARFTMQIFGGIYLSKIVNKKSTKRNLSIIIIAQAFIWFMLGNYNLWTVFIFGLFFNIIHQFFNYTEAEIIHEHIPSKIRASALSARQMVISMFWIPVPILMGFLMQNFPHPILFKIFSMLVLIFSFGILWWRREYI